jgi:aerobic carbon-monoxide dehydrogenase medium subunit
MLRSHARRRSPGTCRCSRRLCGTSRTSQSATSARSEAASPSPTRPLNTRLAGRRGERHVAARDFFKGLYETALARDELLVAGLFPATRPPWRSAVVELARRHGDYAIIGVAAHAKVESGRLSDVRLAYINVGSVPVLARNAAAALEGKLVDEESVAVAQRALADELDPRADLHASAATKLHLARVLTARALAALVA